MSFNPMNHPGHIRYQIGKALSDVGDALKVGDLMTAADLAHWLVTVGFPKLGKSYEECVEEAEKLEAMMEEAMSEFSEQKWERDERKVRPKLTAALNKMCRKFLYKMTLEKHYAYNETPVNSRGKDEMAFTEEGSEASGMTV